MKIGYLIRLVVVVSVTAVGATASAQTPALRSDLEGLARGWTALAQGQAAAAARAAEELLKADSGNHDALTLAVAAAAVAAQPLAGLDAYERWLQASRHEDVYLLRPIAVATLRGYAAGSDPRLRLLALAALADTGDGEARSLLAQATADLGAPADVEADLAASGDAAALGRLEAQVRAPEVRDKSSAIDALAEAGARGSTPAIAAALGDPAPPTRMAAANALAELGATEAVPAIKALLNDPDPAVRHVAEVALARLGQPANGVTLESLAESPIADIKLQAARAAAAADASEQGSWPDRVRPLLSDPDPAVRLKAARLLVEHGRDVAAAQSAIAAALADPTPATRTEAARLLGRMAATGPDAVDPGALRLLLRDPVPDVRIQGARALLRNFR